MPGWIILLLSHLFSFLKYGRIWNAGICSVWHQASLNQLHLNRLLELVRYLMHVLSTIKACQISDMSFASQMSQQKGAGTGKMFHLPPSNMKDRNPSSYHLNREWILDLISRIDKEQAVSSHVHSLCSCKEEKLLTISLQGLPSQAGCRNLNGDWHFKCHSECLQS